VTGVHSDNPEVQDCTVFPQRIPGSCMVEGIFRPNPKIRKARTAQFFLWGLTELYGGLKSSPTVSILDVGRLKYYVSLIEYLRKSRVKNNVSAMPGNNGSMRWPLFL
jgi:hypothetical protein